MAIIIEEFADYSRCVLPDGRPLYGNCLDDISETLDLMAKAGMLEGEIEISKLDDDFDSLDYNR